MRCFTIIRIMHYHFKCIDIGIDDTDIFPMIFNHFHSNIFSRIRLIKKVFLIFYIVFIVQLLNISLWHFFTNIRWLTMSVYKVSALHMCAETSGSPVCGQLTLCVRHGWSEHGGLGVLLSKVSFAWPEKCRFLTPFNLSNNSKTNYIFKYYLQS